MKRRLSTILLAMLLVLNILIPASSVAAPQEENLCLPGQNPSPELKRKMYGDLEAELEMLGLDGKPFDLNVLPNKQLKLNYYQLDNLNYSNKTGVEFWRNVDRPGNYKFLLNGGNPYLFPL